MRHPNGGLSNPYYRNMNGVNHYIVTYGRQEVSVYARYKRDVPKIFDKILNGHMAEYEFYCRERNVNKPEGTVELPEGFKV